MTLDEIRALDCDMITPAQAAGVLGCDPNTIRIAARQRPELLGFPVSVVGHRTRIPRLPFIKFVSGGGE